jgi:PAS fold
VRWANASAVLTGRNTCLALWHCGRNASRPPSALCSRHGSRSGLGGDPHLSYLYNDPYKAIIGGKHPDALGQPTAVVWREVWPEIGPILATAMTGDLGTYVEEHFLVMERNGYPEETYYTFSYTPIQDDAGKAGGIICANTDDTQRVIGERQLRLLRNLASSTADLRISQEVYEKTTQALSHNDKDLPFSLL